MSSLSQEYQVIILAVVGVVSFAFLCRKLMYKIKKRRAKSHPAFQEQLASQDVETPDEKPAKKRRFSARSLISFFWPILPSGYEQTNDMELSDLAQEAKDMQPLLRTTGWKDAAVFHPDRVNIQYLRTMQFVGAIPIMPYVVQLMCVILGAIALAAMLWFGPSFSDTQSLEASKTMYAGVGAVFGSIMGIIVGYSARAITMFGTAYATARVAQKVVDPSGQRRTVAIYELPLLRMAFADRPSERLFSGVEGHSGFINGRMNLETELNLATVTDPRMLYDAKTTHPCESSFTGVNTARRHSLNNMAKEAGRLALEKQARRKNGGGLEGWLGENSCLTFFVISAAVSVGFLVIGWKVPNPSGLLG